MKLLFLHSSSYLLNLNRDSQVSMEWRERDAKSDNLMYDSEIYIVFLFTCEAEVVFKLPWC